MGCELRFPGRLQPLSRRHVGTLFLALGLTGAGFLCFAWADGRSAGPAAASEMPGSATAGDVWRTPRHDSANSLYLFLHLHGHAVAYEDVRAALPARESGHNFTDLREAAGRCGQRTLVHKCRPDDLVHGRLPAIALMGGLPGQGGTFVVLCRFNGNKWQVIDGATAEVEEISLDDFHRHWSGSVLMPRPAWHPWALSIGGSLLALAGYGWLRPRPQSPAQAGAIGAKT